MFEQWEYGLRVELVEFDRMAIALDISKAERSDILGITAADYLAWQGGSRNSPPPALMRRLRYVLPLMRQKLANQAPPPHFVFSERRL